MITSHQLNTELVKSAVFLQTRVVLDATKTRRGRLNCKPPNKPCGSRCIPPSWDCRLKNEGNDTHLQAVKTDPLGGLANIQRGSSRLAKGIVKGNFSEVHGGKQAIIRGVVKATPGNIQQKKQLRSTLEKTTSSIGIGLAAVTGGLGVHTLLKKNNTFGYRQGLGRDIDNAVFAGVSKVLDVLPVIGSDRARVRAGVSQSSAEAAFRQAQSRSLGPEANKQILGEGGEALIPNTPINKTLLNGHSNLQKNLITVNKEFMRRNDFNYLAWDKAHRKAFWSADIAADDLGPDTKRISVFARPAAEEYLAKQFGFELQPGMIREDIKVRLQEKLISEKQNLLSLAEQKGFKVLGVRGGNRYINPKDLDSFISTVVKETDVRDNTFIKSGVAEHIRSTLKDAPSRYANAIYANTVIGFSRYYNEVGSTFDSPEIQADRRQQSARVSFESPLSPDTDRIQKSADNFRAKILARKMGISSDIAGPDHADLVKRAFFTTKVHGPNSATYALSERAMRSAASELSGRPISSAHEAHTILVNQGFTGLVPPRAATPRRSPPSSAAPSNSASSPPRTTRRRATRRRSEAQIVAMLMKGGMSEEAAKNKAKEIIANRKDSNDDWLYTYAAIATRFDKPCGKSYIPESYACGKQAQVNHSSQAQQTAVSKVASNPKSSLLNKAPAILAAGAIATGASYVYLNRKPLAIKAFAQIVDTLSSEQVQKSLDKAPLRFKEPLRDLTGIAKKSAALMLLYATDHKLVHADKDNNFSTFYNQKTGYTSISNVGDTLVLFRTHPEKSIDFGAGEVAERYVMDFTVNNSHGKKTQLNRRDSFLVSAKVETMFNNQFNFLPNESFVTVEPYGVDGLGEKRKKIYERKGFTPIGTSTSVHLWALKTDGKLKKINKRSAYSIKTALRENNRVVRDSLKLL